MSNVSGLILNLTMRPVQYTHIGIDIPAPVLAPLFCLRDPLVHPEVPVHVGRLLLPALLVIREPPSALRARCAEIIVQGSNQLGMAPLKYFSQFHSLLSAF